MYGEITRSAPARSSFFSESSAEARATIKMSERSSRADSAMKMFSASESTQAITAARARDPRLLEDLVVGRRALDDAHAERLGAPRGCSWFASITTKFMRRGAKVAHDLAADPAEAADDVVV